MYAQHPLSAAFPAMPDDDFRALVEDIRTHGQRDVATLADGMVIDGWHRYRACVELRIPCRFETFAGVDAVAFVRSKNQHRRHYQKSQQAAIEVALTTWADAHRPKKVEAASTLSVEKGEAASPFSTNREMAQRAGTTVRTITDAKAAHEAGLGDAVRDGKLSAEKAAAIARADPVLAEKVAHGEVSPAEAVEQITPRREPPAREVSAPRNAPETVCIQEPAEADPCEVESLRTQLAELQERIAELGELAEELREDRDSMARVFEANDQVVAALAEAKRYREQVRILEARIRGQASECAQAKQAAKTWKAKHDKLERARANLAA